MAAPFQIGKHDVDISASIGISLVPQDAISAKTLISNADAAMYAAKNRGRNQAVFYSADLLGTPKESTFGRL